MQKREIQPIVNGGKFKVLNKIGGGAFGDIYKGNIYYETNLYSGWSVKMNCEVAIKFVNIYYSL